MDQSLDSMYITITHVCDPCEYLILDNVCTSEELDKCFSEVELLSPILKNPNKTLSASDENGKLKKKNKGVFLNEIYSPELIQHSPIHIATSKILGTAKNQQYTVYSQMNFLNLINNLSVLLSAYKNGDYYLSHKDNSTLSLLFWFGKHNFIGGDLLLKDFNHTIPFVSNRGIIFPSYYDHEVTKIESSVEDYVRYTATGLLQISGLSNQPTTIGTSDF